MNAGIHERINAVRARIAAAAHACGRDPAAVRLVAVSKTWPAGALAAAHEAGLADFGENYVQEAKDKIAALGHLPLTWHFIGHLQTNKARFAVRLFHLIHTLDSVRLARELDRHAGRVPKVQEVLIQVRLSAEETKSGALPEEVPALLREAAALPHLRVRGLMTLPPFFDDPERARPYFARLRELRDRLQEEAPSGVSLGELSMGMTGDFEAAIAEGATIVRIGTAIFGKRA